MRMAKPVDCCGTALGLRCIRCRTDQPTRPPTEICVSLWVAEWSWWGGGNRADGMAEVWLALGRRIAEGARPDRPEPPGEQDSLLDARRGARGQLDRWQSVARVRDTAGC